MTIDREKERETELESAMYTNCLLLGLDPSIIGVGANNGTPRLGLFRHSNRKLGEHLLYFILSSLRGPKDFDKVWPIFDSTQSRDFLKVLQNIISELESQGAFPRSNSRVSSLATCCGPRFVELLWQLSLHALREVHKRTYADDVVASLTDVAFSHAATLIPVTKAKVSYFFGTFEAQAYLQQELDKFHDLVSSSSQNFHLVQRATHLWDSLLSCKSQHEDLAAGPIEDLIAHRENRYRISGSSLLAAMDESTQVSSGYLYKEEERSQVKVNRENVMENSTSFQPTVDVAQVFRRWTHALQRIHKQLLHLAKENNGEGPDLLRSANDGGIGGHAESLATTLAEHQQYLASIKVLVNQLKGVAPTIQNSISELTEELNTSLFQPQSTGRKTESRSDDVTDISSTIQFHKKRQAQVNTLQTGNEKDYKKAEHFFVPLSGTGFSHVGPEKKLLFASEVNISDGIKYQ